MTFRELTREIMLSKGFTPEEIEERSKYASMHMPGANVDREIPPEDVEFLREYIGALHEVANANPEWVRETLAKHDRKMRASN